MALYLMTNIESVYYSSEVKQYSSDVAVALILYFLALRYIKQEISRGWNTITLGLCGAVAILVSHPSIFILLGVGVSLAYFHLKRRTWRNLAPLLLIGMLWATSFVAVYYVSYQQVDTRQLENYWNKNFMPLPLRSLEDVKWFGVAFLRIFANPVELGSSAIAAMVFIIGFVVMFSQDKEKAFILLSPLGFALIASGFRQYPFSGRLLLFIIPAVLIFIAAGIFQILKQTERFSSIIKVVVIVFLVLPSIEISAYHLLKKPRLREEVKPVLSYMQKHWQEGDTLYIYYGAIPAFLYYRERYGFSHVSYIKGRISRRNWKNYFDDLENLRGRQRVWILLSHTSHSRGIGEKRLFLDYLAQVGIRLSSTEAYGAEAHLYDMGLVP